MSINEYRDRAYANSVAKGWWDTPRSFGDVIALMHSELTEALEEHRSGNKPNEIYYENPPYTVDAKPEGIPIELADVLIRIFDYCGKEGIDIETALELKMAYNLTRPHRHGGKAL